MFIPATRRVKGYSRFVGKYVTGRRKRFRPHKVYIFLISITSRVDQAMSENIFIKEIRNIRKLINFEKCVEVPLRLLPTPVLWIAH